MCILLSDVPEGIQEPLDYNELEGVLTQGLKFSPCHIKCQVIFSRIRHDVILTLITEAKTYLKHDSAFFLSD